MDPVEPTPRMLEVKKKLNSVNPLEGVRAHTEESNYMFQCVCDHLGGPIVLER